MDAATALKDFVLAVQALGPWGVVFFLWWQGQKDQKKWEERFQAVVRMYENNVELVKKYETITKNYQDVIIYNTQTLTEIKESADNNLFCPIVRKETRQREVDR